MTEAPERIWATGNGQTGSWNDHEINPKHAPHQTEYTQKDVSDALVAAAREEALREAAAIAQQKHDAAMEWAAESHFKELVGTDTDSSRIAAEILALITKDADNE